MASGLQTGSTVEQIGRYNFNFFPLIKGVTQFLILPFPSNEEKKCLSKACFTFKRERVRERECVCALLALFISFDNISLLENSISLLETLLSLLEILFPSLLSFSFLWYYYLPQTLVTCLKCLKVDNRDTKRNVYLLWQAGTNFLFFPNTEKSPFLLALP